MIPEERDRISEADLERQDFIKLKMRNRTIMYKTIGDQTYQFEEREPGQYQYYGISPVREVPSTMDVHDMGDPI